MPFIDRVAFCTPTLRSGEKIFFDVETIQTNDRQANSGIIDVFVGALEREEEPIVSGQDVLSSMRTVFAAAKSAKSGSTVTVEK